MAGFNHLLEVPEEEETIVAVDIGISEEEDSIHSVTQAVFVHFRNTKEVTLAIQTRGQGTSMKPPIKVAPIKVVLEAIIAHQDTTEVLPEAGTLMVVLTQVLEHPTEVVVIQQEVELHIQDAEEVDKLVAGMVLL